MNAPAGRAVLVSGSPSRTSRSRALLDHAGRALGDAGYQCTVVDLSALPADGLLGRVEGGPVADAIRSACGAHIVVASSPVYRAAYSGLLKVFFDRFPPDSLVGKVAIPILTGGSPAHLLALDHAFRPLFASLGAVVVAGGVYGHDAQFKGAPDPDLLRRVEDAVREAIRLAAGVTAAPATT